MLLLWSSWFRIHLAQVATEARVWSSAWELPSICCGCSHKKYSKNPSSIYFFSMTTPELKYYVQGSEKPFKGKAHIPVILIGLWQPNTSLISCSRKQVNHFSWHWGLADAVFFFFFFFMSCPTLYKVYVIKSEPTDHVNIQVFWTMPGG